MMCVMRGLKRLSHLGIGFGCGLHAEKAGRVDGDDSVRVVSGHRAERYTR